MDRRNIGIVAFVLAFSLLAFAPARAQQDRRNPNAGYLGIKLGPVSAEIQTQLKLESMEGIVVLELVPNSPAEKAGIQKFDIIRKVDGREVADKDDFVELMEGSKPDQQMSFSVMREGKMQDVAVTLGKRPADMFEEKDPDEGHDKHEQGPTTKPGK